MEAIRVGGLVGWLVGLDGEKHDHFLNPEGKDFVEGKRSHRELMTGRTRCRKRKWHQGYISSEAEGERGNEWEASVS